MVQPPTRVPTILLFDLDGTLLSTAGAGRRAIERAFVELYNRRDACAAFRFDGMTDRAIVRRGLEAVGMQATPRAVAAVLDAYVTLLRQEVKNADPGRYRVFPGVREAVAQARDAGLAVGLGTGNVRNGARIKLDPVGLFSLFDFGGFGCDAEDRPELLSIGAARGARQLGLPLAQCRVVVIGDTPKDVASARAIGAESIGVGTGSYAETELLAAGATAAFRDLTVPGAVSALLGGIDDDCVRA
jgi:phosphoglycolate phosphatase-like HAD superfamily hydrolase